MLNQQYTSIKSVLYDLSLTLPEMYWNEAHMLEWAYKALAKMNVEQKLEQAVSILMVDEHKSTLPSDLKYLVSIAYRAPLTSADEEYLRQIIGLEPLEHVLNGGIPSYAVIPIYEYATNSWAPLRLSTNNFASSIHLNASSYTSSANSSLFRPYDFGCSGCAHEYTVSASGCITTSFPSGCLMVAYLRYPSDINGDTLIPNEEDLKEAILHYCLYRYWLTKVTVKEEGAEQRRDFHLSMFETLKTKAIAGPTVQALENMMHLRNRMIPSTNMYSGQFSGLGTTTSNTFG